MTITKIGGFKGVGAEISAFDPTTSRLFVISGDATIQVLDLKNPHLPQLLPNDATRPNISNGIINLSSIGAQANSVTIKNGIVAVAIQAATVTDPGSVAFFDSNGNLLKTVTVGALPDMLTFTPDGKKVLVANEGEPNEDYTIDPEGSISIIDIGNGVNNATVSTATFTDFNPRKAELQNEGVRIINPNPFTVAQDIEPEYISVSGDGTKAFVTLQENNAFAVVDINQAKVLDIIPLGYKDHNKGQASLQQSFFPTLPDLGTTSTGQTIKLGGFSGLAYKGTANNGNLQFVTVPDRGPDAGQTLTDLDGSGRRERIFLVPNYQLQVVGFEYNPTTKVIENITQTFLTRQDGTTPITGLPNIQGVDEEPVVEVTTGGQFTDSNGKQYNPLSYDPFGGDLEGIVINPADNSYWMADEYRPAIYHFDSTGKLIDRYIPTGIANTFGNPTLPADYAKRQNNRGFEAIALDSTNNIVYAFIQSPLNNPDSTTGPNSSLIRILGINPTNGTPVSEYVYLLENPTHRSDGLVDKIGDAIYAGDGKFYVIERDAGLDPTSKKYIFEIDLKGATNTLNTNLLPANTTLEQLSADGLLAAGIKPVFKNKVTNLPSLGYLPSDKPEGLTMLSDGRLAVLNDNDFAQVPGADKIALGLISFSGNTLDPSDRDNAIKLGNWPVFGMYQPDSIASFTANGKTYYVTANEGDSRVRPTGNNIVPGVNEGGIFNEEIRLGNSSYVLDPTVFPNATTLKDNANLGRLNVTNKNGDIDGDGDFDRIYTYGARSFTVWDEFGNMVYDSGDSFEKITAQQLPTLFNSDGNPANFDTRSDNKGPEPEGVATGIIDGKPYSFIGLERVGGVMVYDMSNPISPQFKQYLPSEVGPNPATPIDQGPEGVTFISAADSPNATPLVVINNEVSRTVSVLAVEMPKELIFGSATNTRFEVGVTPGFNGNRDIIFAGPNSTFIDVSAGAGNNRIVGGAGNDELNASRFDIINGGPGNDIIDSSRGQGQNRLYGGPGNDQIFVGNNDTAFGEAGNDEFFATSGNIGNNRLYGGAGDDKFDLGKNNRVFGDDGNDQFFMMGEGNNTVTGGLGADQFWISVGSIPLMTNIITDFELGTDKIGIGGLGITSTTQLSITQQGADTLIATTTSQNLALLRGIQATQLTATNFMFS